GIVEEMGIRRTHESAASSDIVIHVFEGSRRFAVADRELSELGQLRPSIQVVTKSDLPRKLKFPPNFPLDQPLLVSSMTATGIESLKNRIEALACVAPSLKSELEYFVNDRQADAIANAIHSLTECE